MLTVGETTITEITSKCLTVATVHDMLISHISCLQLIKPQLQKLKQLLDRGNCTWYANIAHIMLTVGETPITEITSNCLTGATAHDMLTSHISKLTVGETPITSKLLEAATTLDVLTYSTYCAYSWSTSDRKDPYGTFHRTLTCIHPLQIYVQ